MQQAHSYFDTRCHHDSDTVGNEDGDACSFADIDGYEHRNADINSNINRDTGRFADIDGHVNRNTDINRDTVIDHITGINGNPGNTGTDDNSLKPHQAWGGRRYSDNKKRDATSVSLFIGPGKGLSEPIIGARFRDCQNHL
jgi:hypothetical protein